MMMVGDELDLDQGLEVEKSMKEVKVARTWNPHPRNPKTRFAFLRMACSQDPQEGTHQPSSSHELIFAKNPFLVCQQLD